VVSTSCTRILRASYLEGVEVGGRAESILGKRFGMAEVLVRDFLDFVRHAL